MIRIMNGGSVKAGALLAHVAVRLGRGGVGEVLQRTLGVGLDRLAALLPVSGADLAVLVLRISG